MVELSVLIQAIRELGPIEKFMFFGAILAFILTGLQIREYLMKRVILVMKIDKAEFRVCETGYVTGERETFIDIEVDINNKGLASTTISAIELQTDIKEIKKVKLENDMTKDAPFSRPVFNQIKISGSDRRIVHFFSHAPPIPEKTKTINGKLVFKNPGKDIIEEIILKRIY